VLARELRASGVAVTLVVHEHKRLGRGIELAALAEQLSSLRRRMISSTISGVMAAGEVFGRRDRGSNAASPSARYRATSLDTHPLDTP
jgi:hypothetical protein